MWNVTIYHGENGSLAWVMGDDQECAGSYSTIRNGAEFLTLARAHAARLNAAETFAWGVGFAVDPTTGLLEPITD